MADDDRLARDEARKEAQHEAVKATLRHEVNRAIAAEGRARVADEDARIADVGRELEARAVREVAESDREVRTARGAARVAQVIDYLFCVVYALIAIEIVLELAGAADTNGFKRAMDVVSAPFLAPFRGLFSDPSIGPYRFMFSYLAGLVAWILLHLAVRGLIRLFGQRRVDL